MTTTIVYPHPLTAKENADFWSKVEVLGPDDCWVFDEERRRLGYGQFYVGGRQIGAHRIAWEIVAGPIPDGLFVCHHCDNRACVNFAHLFLGTHVDNMADMVEKGRQAKGSKNGQSLLTEVTALEARELAAAGWSFAALARRYDVSRECIWLCCTGTTWKHVGGPLQERGKNRDRRATGENHPRVKLTDAQIVEMRELAAAGARNCDLALAFRVNRSHVSRVVRGLARKSAGGPVRA